ncbi:10791_t:CDS:1 [Scutellospora calospora]|uniref:10791_t:CDS:1 n=1 Tax=Scutellospora calospora TaxID=85575 RepID=A0ACA9M4Y5_9GLOM|nr:10791_t:CDS:1 [Scutellospora calospora]
MNNNSSLQSPANVYTTPDRKICSSVLNHLITTTNGVFNSSNVMDVHLASLSPLNISPNASPCPSPKLRPVSSPLTPITPLVLTDSHYEKEFLNNIYHNNHEYFYHTQQVHTLHNQYGYHDQHGYGIQPSSSFVPNSPSPLSSGASTPTCSKPYNIIMPYSHNSDFSHLIACGNGSLSLFNTSPQLKLNPAAEMFNDLIISNENYENNLYNNQNSDKCLENFYYNHNIEYQKAHFSSGENNPIDNDMQFICSSAPDKIITMNKSTLSHQKDSQFHDIITKFNNLDILDSH